jgi:hypothetical protein
MIVTDRRGRPFRHPETPDEPPGRQELFFRGENTSVVFQLVRWDRNDKLMPVSRAEAAMFTKELSGPQP